MLANSWYPHVYFKLSFGIQDQITSKLDSLSLEISEPILKFRDSDKRLLRQAVSKQKLDDSFLTRSELFKVRPITSNQVL
jgi:hypothetical protein